MFTLNFSSKTTSFFNSFTNSRYDVFSIFFKFVDFCNDVFSFLLNFIIFYKDILLPSTNFIPFLYLGYIFEKYIIHLYSIRRARPKVHNFYIKVSNLAIYSNLSNYVSRPTQTNLTIATSIFYLLLYD